MPRKSAASLSVVAAGPRPILAPPPELSTEEAALWREVVESKPAEWFGNDSAPLLREYVRAACICDQLDAKIKNLMASDANAAEMKVLFGLRDGEAKRAAIMATKLRLTQQSRYTPQAASTASKRAQGRRPWQD